MEDWLTTAALEYGKPGWFRVRRELAKEITSNVTSYSKILGRESIVKTIITHLKVTKINDKIPASKWLSKMDHGQAIANTFHRPVVFLSLEESLTFIPTTTSVDDKK